MVNFNLIEGDTTLDDKSEEFVKLYGNQDLTIEEIREILGITRTQFQNMRRKLVKSGELKQVRNPYGGKKKQFIRKNSTEPPKNYTYNPVTKFYQVRYRGRYYACFKKERQAISFVRRMRRLYWNWDRREEIKQRVLKEVD